MKIFFTTVLILSTMKAMACWCGTLPDIKRKIDLKSYDFIALVEIKGLAAKTRFGRENGDIKMNVIELFKGTISSDAVDPGVNSSCSLSFEVGEQWLFFGIIVNGKVQVSSCSYTTPYRDATGKREWSGGYAIKQLGILRALYEKPSVAGAANNVFYQNGKLEVRQVFKNGLLDGVRKIYYPTGQLYIAEKFKMGKRFDYRYIYSKTGQLISYETYKNGSISEHINYYDTTETVERIGDEVQLAKGSNWFDKERNPPKILRTLDSLRRSKTWAKQIWVKYNYTNNGRSYTRKFYTYDGKLDAETYLDWDKKVTEHKMYYPDGKLRSYSFKDQINDQELETDYHEDGKKEDYSKKCVSCKFYFDGKRLPSAPEEIYVQ